MGIMEYPALYERAHKITQEIIENAGSGHYATSMSALPILFSLIFLKRVNPKKIILSKGHAAPALYACLYIAGYLAPEDILSFRKEGGLPGHPELGTNGVGASSGSLGMGISKAVGMAIADPNSTYHVIVGDGELQEGQNWEALNYIYEQNIKNICIHIDQNGHQYSGLTTKTLPIGKLNQVKIWRTDWEKDNKYCTRAIPGWEDYNRRKELHHNEILFLMEQHENIVILTADLEQDFLLSDIKEKYPERYFNVGICEQHMVSMANGMAGLGKIPICYTFGAFWRRAVDQMYNNGCDERKILYVAGLCGTFPVRIGKSHHSSEFETTFGAVPNLEKVLDLLTFMSLPDNKSGYLELRI